MNLRIALGLAVILQLLAGCTSPQPDTIATSSTNNSQLSAWELKGKIGITTPADRVNASVDWHQEHDSYQIQLTGPLGQGRVEISGNQGKIELLSRGERVQGDSAERLMLDQLGWSVPVQHFSYWAKGEASPLTAITQIEFNEFGSPSLIVQDGWQVELSRYQSVTGWLLPGKMLARTGDLSLVLVMKEWRPL